MPSCLSRLVRSSPAPRMRGGGRAARVIVLADAAGLGDRASTMSAGRRAQGKQDFGISAGSSSRASRRIRVQSHPGRRERGYSSHAGLPFRGFAQTGRSALPKTRFINIEGDIPRKRCLLRFQVGGRGVSRRAYGGPIYQKEPDGVVTGMDIRVEAYVSGFRAG